MPAQLGVPVRASACDDAALDLRAEVRGGVFLSWDPGYDDARAVRNGPIDHSTIANDRCSGVADVIACLYGIRNRGLLRMNPNNPPRA